MIELRVLFSGFLGAVLGWLGACYLQWWCERQRRRAAGCGVLAEMMTNVNRAIDLEATGIPHGFPDITWRSQLPLVAQLLPWSDLRKLVVAYDSAQRHSDNVRDLKFQQRLEPNWRETSLRLAKEFRQAIEVLYHKVLCTKDHSGFQSDLEKLDKRLKDVETSIATNKAHT